MRWEDERYVRLYTRDTADWLSLSFEAQGLLALLLRKSDRAGLIELGKRGKRAVAVIIGHPDAWPRLEPALEELLADGCLVLNDATLVFPNFIEAQETQVADAQRQRELRDRRRAAGLVRAQSNGKDVWVKPESNFIQVTAGHEVTNQVTPAVPNQPCLAVPEEREATAAGAAPPVVEPGTGIPIAVAPAVLQQLWNETAHRSLPRWEEMSEDRRKKARQRLKERPLVGDRGWQAVIERINASAFLRGESERGWRATPDWLLKPSSAGKVLQGDYDDRRGPGPPRDVRKGVTRAEDFDHSNQEADADGIIRLQI